MMKSVLWSLSLFLLGANAFSGKLIIKENRILVQNNQGDRVYYEPIEFPSVNRLVLSQHSVMGLTATNHIAFQHDLSTFQQKVEELLEQNKDPSEVITMLFVEPAAPLKIIFQNMTSDICFVRITSQEKVDLVFRGQDHPCAIVLGEGIPPLFPYSLTIDEQSAKDHVMIYNVSARLFSAQNSEQAVPLLASDVKTMQAWDKSTYEFSLKKMHSYINYQNLLREARLLEEKKLALQKSKAHFLEEIEDQKQIYKKIAFSLRLDDIRMQPPTQKGKKALRPTRINFDTFQAPLHHVADSKCLTGWSLLKRLEDVEHKCQKLISRITKHGLLQSTFRKFVFYSKVFLSGVLVGVSIFASDLF